MQHDSGNQFNVGKERSKFWITWETAISSNLISHILQTVASQLSKLEFRGYLTCPMFNTPEEAELGPEARPLCPGLRHLPRCGTFSQGNCECGISVHAPNWGSGLSVGWTRLSLDWIQISLCDFHLLRWRGSPATWETNQIPIRLGRWQQCDAHSPWTLIP